MRKIFSKIALGALLAVFGVTASAAPQWCTGTVTNLWVYSNGAVYVKPSYRADYTQICNMNAETNGISVTTCVAWFAVLRSAVQRQSSVLVYYTDTSSCNTLPTYESTPVPGYVMQMN